MTKVNAMGLGVMLPNGATVIAFFEGPRGGIVLARRDHELHPYVTWAYVENDLSSTTSILKQSSFHSFYLFLSFEWKLY